jgi:protein phosphatase
MQATNIGEVIEVGPGPVLIRLPEPCLVVLVGAAGSGKSTLAARLFPGDRILSSDAHRGLVSGDETNQTATRTAFAILHRRLARRLADHQTTVVDATNVTSYARRSLVRRATDHGVPAVAIVLDLEPRLVLARNAARAAGIVPEAAVERQLADLERSLRRGSLEHDGFEAVHVLRSPEAIGGVAIEWVSPLSRPR